MNNFQNFQALKILSCYNDFEKGGKIAFIGEIREYNGRKFQKQANDKWIEIHKEKHESKDIEYFLTEEDKKNIYSYTTYDWHTLNGALRKKITIPEADKNKVGHYAQILNKVDNLNKALDKIPDFKGKVNRWVNSYKENLEDHLDDYSKGDVIQFDSFLSTSKSETVPSSIYGSNDIKFEIESKTGKDISNMTDFPDEKEILFKSGSVFEVRNIKIKKLKNGKISNIIVNLVEL